MDFLTKNKEVYYDFWTCDGVSKELVLWALGKADVEE
jgi:hypothetical protein